MITVSRKLWILAAFVSIHGNNGPELQKDLNIVSFVPLTGKTWPGGRALIPALHLGFRDVNARADILPGYRLNMILGDTKCHEGVSTNVMYEMLYTAPVKHMITGPVCSTVAEVQAQAAHFWNISHFAFGAKSPLLSDKTRFPRFFRINPSDTRYNLARLALLEHFNWHKIATINVATDFFSAVMEDLALRLKGSSTEIITQEIFDHDPTLRVQNLKKKDARIIMAASYEPAGRLILCAAYKLGLYGPKVVWMFPGWFVDYWWRYGLDDVPCTREQMDLAAEGSFITGIYFSNPNDEMGIAGFRPSDFRQMITEEPSYTPETKAYEFLVESVYDTVWASALALNCSIQAMHEQGYSKTLDEFEYSDGDIGDIMTSCIYNVSFLGLTGAVKFDRSGEPLKNIRIVQIQDSVKVTVGTYVVDETPWRLEWHNGGIRWQDGVAPRDSTQITWLEQSLSVRLYVGMSVCATAGICLAASLLIFNIIYCQHRYVKLSSPNINNVLVAGCILTYSTVFMYSFNGASQMLCQLRHFTFTIGFTVAFGAMFSKTWRVYKIFCNKKLLRVKINDFQLLGLVVLLVVVMVIILSVWAIVDPLFVRTVYLEQQAFETGNDAVAIPFVHECTSHYYYYFLCTICIVEGVMLTFGAFLSYETRKVRIEALNDARQIGMCLYNVIVLSVLVLLLSVLLTDQTQLVYGIFSGFVILGTSTTLLIIFIPKIQSVYYPHTVEVNPDGSVVGSMAGTVSGLQRSLEPPRTSTTEQTVA